MYAKVSEKVGTKESFAVYESLFRVEEDGKETVGKQLVEKMLSLCFVKGFTVTSSAAIDPKNITKDLIWGNGIGTNESKNDWRSSTGIIANRIILIQAFLALVSQNLYFAPVDLSKMSNPFLTLLVSEKLPQSEAFFYSLVNSVCSYDPVGWGIPYNHILYSEKPEDLMRLNAELLGIVLTHMTPKLKKIVVEKVQDDAAADEPQKEEKEPEKKDDAEVNGEEKKEEGEEKKKEQPELEEEEVLDAEIEVPFKAPEENIFVNLARAISGDDDFAFIYKGLTTHICNQLEASSTLLPFSRKSDECYCENLVIFWRLLQENKEFSTFCLSQPTACERVIIPILCYVKQGVQDPSGVGLLRLCEFLLLCLSEDRMFGVACNAAAPSRSILSDAGSLEGGSNYADLFIMTLSNLVTGGSGRAPKPSILLESFLTVLTNITPFTKKLTNQSSMQLVQLVSHMSKPAFIKSTDRSFLYLSLALEAINNLLLYQPEGNLNMLYSVLRAQKDFVTLADLTFETFSDKIEPKTPLAKQAMLQQQQEMLAKKKRIFKPSKEWFDGWKDYIPLEIILDVVKNLQPKIDKICKGDADDEQLIHKFLENQTLVGIVPVPHPIVIRKQQFNAVTLQWLTSYLWGVTYLNCIQLFEKTQVKLFIVRSGN